MSLPASLLMLLLWDGCDGVWAVWLWALLADGVKVFGKTNVGMKSFCRNKVFFVQFISPLTVYRMSVM